jgi:hypothetical protein
MLRHLFTAASLLSALLCVVLAALWIQSFVSMDVFMIPTGQHRAILITSHPARVFQVGAFVDLPDPRWGAWSGDDTRNVGPFKLWQSPAGKFAGAICQTGRVFMPCAKGSSGLAYHHSYDRAVELGYPYLLTLQWSWIPASGWEITMPFGYPLSVAALLPLAWTAAFFHRRSQRHLRLVTHCCPSCGYDLRASAGHCPECGAAIAARASDDGA